MFRVRFFRGVAVRGFPAGLIAVITLLCSGVALGAKKVEVDSAASELQARWPYIEPFEHPAEGDGELFDFILGPDVFTHARIDLGDLRLYDTMNAATPYSLRVLRPDYRRDRFPAEEFNRAEGPDNSSVLTLDLKRDDLQHNEVEIVTPGNNFRRRAELEGSDDGKQWSSLASTDLIRFRRKGTEINGNTITYPTSRFRYLRVGVSRDPSVDSSNVNIESVNVVHKVEVPGEMLTLDAQLGPRQPVRAQSAPGSAWMIDLGGDKVPVERIEVVIDDEEFARNYYIEWGGPPDSQQRFQRVALADQGLWQRRAGEAKVPMVATFNEVRASRLKLVVIDHQNPVLKIRSVKFTAPARQVVFARSPDADAQWRLFFGNPESQLPNYDFARNLPTQLDPAPTRGTLGPLEPNPKFVPPPLPLTERYPWLIYVVLGSVSVVLALIILSLARLAIAQHDRTQAPEQAAA